MNYEKKYKEALERARNVYKGLVGTADLVAMADLEEVFPELKESEDERIRTFLHHTFTAQYLCKDKSGTWHREPVINILTWLEKQGESDETKAKTFLINKGYPIDANGTFPTYEELYNIIIEGLEHQGEKPINNTDEQKPAEWSEEDEKMRNNLIRLLIRLSANTQTNSTTPNYSYPNEIDWLNSLKQRYTWRPSDEQIRTLEYYMHTLRATENKEVLFGLYEDLKKLTE